MHHRPRCREIGVPADIRGTFQGTAPPSELARQRAGADLAALVAVYIVLGVLYESYVHPITISRRCPRPASAPCWR
jgi:multidrug efflux pump subunit AcrB